MGGTSLNNYSPSQAAFLGGFVGTIFMSVCIFAVIYYIIFIIAYWKILVKAGEKGWKALIPFYNVYMMYKIVKMKSWFWYLIGMSICAEIMMLADGYPYGVNASQMATFDPVTHPMTAIAIAMILFVSLIAMVIYVYRTSKVFGHGNLFAAGLFFFPYIFLLILGFGKSDYNKKRLKK